MAILVQRGKGNRDYQEVGPEYPLQVEINQSQGQPLLVRPLDPEPVGYTSFTIAATAGTIFSLADSGMPTKPPAGAVCFLGTLETAQVRVRGGIAHRRPQQKGSLLKLETRYTS